MSFDSKLLRRAATYAQKRLARRAAAIVASAACVLASPAYAQVMDISSDGTVAVRQGSGAAKWEVISSPASDQIVAVNGPAVPGVAITSVDPAPVPQQYAAALNFAANTANISPALLAALVWQESRWKPTAVSRKGAIGLTQLMPGTARDLRVDPTDPLANLIGGARYLRQLLDQFDGDVEKALAAYNAGPARVRSAGGVPAIPETMSYVASIVRRISTVSLGGSQ